MSNKTTTTAENKDKLRGGYYTPAPITKFICDWAITDKNNSVLEPSCGDGNFLEAIAKRLIHLEASKRTLNKKITGIELFEEEAEKSRDRIGEYGLKRETIINNDFFSFVTDLDKKKKFDVIVGNPPFIRYQNFPHDHREKAIGLMREQGLKPNKLTNIWIPFLVVSSTLLSKNGRMGMVIPAELFQVKYAAETRVFLSKFFEQITVVTFRKLVFEGIQQEVILLLCDKKSKYSKGIRFLELNNLDEMEEVDFDKINGSGLKPIDHSKEKWTKYFLDTDEIILLRDTKKRADIPKGEKVVDVDVGIVTGKNAFFMINEETAKEWKILPYTQRVVGRSPHVKGLYFTEKDFQDNLKAGHSSLLFYPPNVPFEELPKACQAYILYGEEKGFNTGYKCRIRKRWYITPSLWTPPGFGLRQINRFPKLILNQNQASSTDTIHRVKFQKGYDPELVALSFLNSLTFAFSEVTGRSYGGGVMTFEPTEIEELPIPVLDSSENIDANQIDQLLRERRIDEVLDIIDQELLIKQLKFEQEQVDKFRAIWLKLSNRRINRKKRK